MSILGIITVVTNEKHNLKEFYFSLKEQSFKDFTLYFVDNNSSDGSVELFKDLNKNNDIKVSYIQLSYNSGFSGGCNAGAEKAIAEGSKYLFFSNNDLVYDPNAMLELQNLLASDDTIACAGPLLFKHKDTAPDEIQEFGGKINFKKGRLEKFFTNKNIKEITVPETLDSDFVGGGVCFIKADVFSKIGMFENSYFAYFDEIDLAYRLKVINRNKIIVTSKAKIWHNHKWSAKNNYGYYFEYYLSQRNKILYFRKYGLYSAIFLSVAEDLLKFPWRALWFIKVCDYKLPLYYLKGMFDGLLNKKGKPALGFIK
ncbi:MAG: glycosyltransferase family 2 protein [Ignavibacteria bacterium]